jgi:hypothetical protein
VPDPSRLDLGALLPGGEATHDIALRGNFPTTPAHLELRDRREIPSCVTAELAGASEGKSQPVTVNQGYKLAVRVAPYCGPASFHRDVQTRVRLVFESPPGARYLPPVEIPVTFSVDSEIEAPAVLKVRVRGGETEDADLGLRGNWRRDLALRGTLATAAAPGRWPEDDHLAMTFGAEATPGEAFALPPGEAGPPLRLRVEAHPCCAAGSYTAELRLEPADLAGYAQGVRPPEPLRIPLQVEVESAGIWACYGYWILRALAVLVALALLLYVANMIRKSHFLVPARLAEKMVPLVWTAHGATVPVKDYRPKVLDVFRGALPWHRRLGAWLKANPLAFGWPGSSSYQESLELFLQPHRDASRSTALLVPERSFATEVQKDPARYAGRLFATAQGGLSFVGVPDKQGRIGRLTPDRLPVISTAGDLSRSAALRLNGHKLLRPLEDWEAAEEGRAAGWQVG